MAGGMTSLFGPDMMARAAAQDPKVRGYLNDPLFNAKIQLLQKDPNQLTNMLSDPRIMEVFQAILKAQGMDLRTEGGEEEEEDSRRPSPGAGTRSTPTTAENKAAATTPAPMEQDDDDDDGIEDMTDYNPEERKKLEDKKAAIRAKDRGNELYKDKKFDEAIAAYNEAIALDPTNMTFLSNKAAVYFTTKQYDECIVACTEAVEVGKANRAPCNFYTMDRGPYIL